MKKLLTSLATVVLMTGSVATVGSAFQHHPQQTVGSEYQTQQTREHNNFQATNEDAEDIANKLWNQTIKTRPKFWFNKDIKDYQTQFNAQIVKQGILTADEVKYVTWGSFKIAQAFHYYGKTPFTVTKDGAVCTGHVNLDAHADQKHLIEKLTNNTLQFNYDYWNGKTVNDELPLLRSMFANEGILTPAQASDIIGLTTPIKITKGGQIAVSFIISDNKSLQQPLTNGSNPPQSYNINDNQPQETVASNLNIVNDGDQAATVASTITGASIRLKANDGGVYADNSTTANDVARNIDALYPGLNISHVWMQHKKITPYTSAAADTFQTTIYKDGQSATTTLVLVYKSQPAAHNIKALSSTSSDLRIIANFSPLAAKDFLQYTQKSEAFDDPYKYIWYLFDLLNNGAWTEGGSVFPDVPNVGFDDPLAGLMAGFGDPSQSRDRIIEELALNLDPGESYDFFQDLYGWFEYNETISPYMPANPGSYPSIEFDLHYQDAATYYISSYSFW